LLHQIYIELFGAKSVANLPITCEIRISRAKIFRFQGFFGRKSAKNLAMPIDSLFLAAIRGYAFA
jgi:hypothetical protein